MSKRRQPKQNNAEHMLAVTLDKMSLLDDISEEIFPILRQAIRERWPREKVFGHPVIEALLAVRQASIAIKDPDSGKALAAIKDAVDRKEGKARERIEQTHKLEKLPDEQLDALLKSKLGRASEDDEDETLVN